MAKYILRINGEAYIKDEDLDVIMRFYAIGKKYYDESALTITLEMF